MNMSKTKEKTLAWLSLVVLSDRALLPLDIKTNQGYFAVEPIQELDYRNRSALVEGLISALQKGNPERDVPDWWTKKEQTPMEKLAKAKSWRDLEKKSIYFSILVHELDIRIEAWGRASNGAWSDEKDTVLDVRIPASSGAEGIADVILEHLKTRKDLPGLSFGPSQQQTAKGA
ncbi:MAG: hypothetical protein K8F91_17040 [Candidatus Obscuribacterales bacterium]|nr:hypothetical protein [Candidatus Obscuribacterales bacterium]